MVKVVILFLALLFGYIGFSPCTDTDTFAHDHTNHEDHHKDHHENHHHEDSCSPLCVCHCCGSSVIVKELNLFSFLQKKIKVYRVLHLYAFFYTYSYSSTTWHPPHV